MKASMYSDYPTRSLHSRRPAHAARALLRGGRRDGDRRPATGWRDDQGRACRQRTRHQRRRSVGPDGDHRWRKAISSSSTICNSKGYSRPTLPSTSRVSRSPAQRQARQCRVPRPLTRQSIRSSGQPTLAQTAGGDFHAVLKHAGERGRLANDLRRVRRPARPDDARSRPASIAGSSRSKSPVC